MKKNKIKKSIFGLLLLAVMCFAVGCGSGKFNASEYVKAVLDGSLQGNYDQYSELTGVSAEESSVAEYYDSSHGTEQFMERVSSSINFDNVSEEKKQEIKSVFERIGQKYRYEIGEAEKKDDGSYDVKVTVSPIDMGKVMENMSTEELKKLAISASDDDDTKLESYIVLYGKIADDDSDSYYADPVEVTVNVSEKKEESERKKMNSEIADAVGGKVYASFSNDASSPADDAAAE